MYAWCRILEIVKCNEATIVALGIGKAYGTIIAAFIAASMVCNQLYSERVTKERSRWLVQLKKDVSKYLSPNNEKEKDKDELYYRICFNLNKRDCAIDKKVLYRLSSIKKEPNKDWNNTEEMFQALFKFEWERIKTESDFSMFKIFPFNFIMIIINEIRIEIEKYKAIKKIDKIISGSEHNKNTVKEGDGHMSENSDNTVDKNRTSIVYGIILFSVVIGVLLICFTNIPWLIPYGVILLIVSVCVIYLEIKGEYDKFKQIRVDIDEIIKDKYKIKKAIGNIKIYICALENVKEIVITTVVGFIIPVIVSKAQKGTAPEDGIIIYIFSVIFIIFYLLYNHFKIKEAKMLVNELEMNL